MKKSPEKVCLVALLFFSIIGTIFFHLNHSNIKNGQIRRSYDELINFLEEEPEDITAIPYEENLPNIVKRDIEKMLNSEKELEIYYSNNDNSSYIKIIKSNKSPCNICFILYEKDLYNEDLILVDNISMYKNNENIVIYGTHSDCFLEPVYGVLNRCEILKNTLRINSKILLYFDLFGTEYATIDSDNVVNYSYPDATLIKSGKNFMFYHLGKQIGETITFPGNEIKQMSPYIIDNKNDIYYMYYNITKDSLWVKFSKIDSNVTIPLSFDSYENELVMISKDNKEKIRLPIYLKNERRYVGIPDFNTYKAFCLTHNYDKNDFTPDFNVHTLELSDKNIEYIELYMEGGFTWYLKYYYKENGIYLYESKRVVGLDPFIGEKLISEERLKDFDGKKFSLDEKDKIIQELKDLYSEYENAYE